MNTPNLLKLERAATALAALAVCASAFGQAFKNPSFNQGLKGWKTDFDAHGETKCTVAPKAGVRSGRCLKFAVVNSYSRATLSQVVKLPDPKKHYLVSFSTKVSSPAMIGGVYPRIEYQNKGGRPVKIKGDGWAQGKVFYLYLYSSRERSGWLRRSYFVPAVRDAASVRIMIDVKCPPGEVLLDEFALTRAPGREKFADMLHYAPFLNCGYGPCDRIVRLQKAGSPFTKSNGLYHKALMRLTDAQERLERYERACFYAKSGSARPLRKRFSAALAEVAALHDSFGTLYVTGRPEGLATEFDPKALATARKLDALVADIEAAFAELAQSASIPWKGPKNLCAVRPVHIPADGKLHGLVFGSLSKSYHFEMEKVIGDFLQVRALFKVAPKLINGKFYWKRPKSYLENARKQGIKYFITTFPHFVRGTVVHPDFAAAHKDDPEIYLHPKKFQMPEKRPGWRGPFNYFNPAVRQSTKNLVREYFVHIYDHLKKDEGLIFVTNWEDVGPYAALDGGLRFVGYGKTALREFRAHLKRKYGTIAALNKAHRSRYKSFDEIRPPEFDLRQPWFEPEPTIPRVDPMRYEFSSWTHLVHARYNREVYEEIKRTNPKAIVFADYNYVGLCLGYDPLMLFEGCDWLNNHGGAYRQFLPQSAMFASLKRYHGKQLATFEDHWGRQDDEHRPGEETAKRLNIIRHMGRLASRGYLFQTWWYSYTGGTYVVSYGSANWADPTFDLTTFRYCATGLRTGIERARRFERQFADTTKVRSRIALIVPEVSCYHQFIEGKTHATTRDLYRLLYGKNRRFEFLTEKLILGGRAKLDDYDVALVPYAPYFPKGLWGKLAPWIDRGGTLIAVGPSGLYDEFGYDDPASLTRALVSKPFPEDQLNTRGPWKWDNGKVIREKAHGKGKLVLVSCTMADLYTSTPLTRRFLSFFARVPIPATSPDTPAEVELRRDAKGASYVFALNPLTDAAIEGTVQVQGKFSAVLDLGVLDGFPVPDVATRAGVTVFRFRLAPGQYTFFRLKK